MPENRYVHGYSTRESERLSDQAGALTALLHDDTRYPAGSQVLEAGCGIGAQTVILARNSPGAVITSVDISPESIRGAEARIRNEGITNVTFRVGDIYSLPFPPGSFDHIFVCFVLEHLADPGRASGRLRPFLKDGGTITVIEGDHGSTFFHPDNADAHEAVGCLVRLQQDIGGNALVGRESIPSSWMLDTETSTSHHAWCTWTLPARPLWKVLRNRRSPPWSKVSGTKC